MDITPATRGSARLWQHVEPWFSTIAVWTEKKAGGEDADPLVLYHRPSGTGLLAVFDGVGGSGRACAGRTPSGVERTQAWIASRRVRGLVEEWFADESAGTSAAGLCAHLGARLATGVVRRGRLRGSIQRDLPTTFAGLLFTVTGPEVGWDVLWAGDSRCYVAEPRRGLQQLSNDDTEPGDALALLLQDPPMTNMVSAGREFVINRWRGRAALPCVLVCATDGFFGYVETPAEFEHLLWETLLTAQDSTHWSALLADRVESYTKDDASLCVAAIGFEDFDALRASFRDRLEWLTSRHAEPMRQVVPGDRTALVIARERSWRLYQAGYEARLPVPGGNDR